MDDEIRLFVVQKCVEHLEQQHYIVKHINEQTLDIDVKTEFNTSLKEGQKYDGDDDRISCC